MLLAGYSARVCFETACLDSVVQICLSFCIKSAGNTLCINEHFCVKGQGKMYRNGVTMSFKTRSKADRKHRKA